MADGNIICGKCATHQVPKAARKKQRLSSAKPPYDNTDMLMQQDYCPVHGFKDAAGDDDDAATEFQPTRRVMSNDY